MKSSVKLGVIFIGLTILGYAEGWGADWRLFETSPDGVDYYDSKSITRSSENMVRVWVKSVFSEKGAIRTAAKLGKGFENLSYSLALNEIDCGGKKYRILSLTLYSKDGLVLWSSSSPSESDYIAPESIMETLYKAVCK